MKTINKRTVKKSAKSKDGRALPKAYVAVKDLEDIARRQKATHATPGTITIKEAMTLLGTKEQNTWRLVRKHKLRKVVGPISTENGLGRKTGVRLYRAEVEELRRKLNGKGQSENPVLANGSENARAIPEKLTRNQGGRPPNAETDAVYKFCYEQHQNTTYTLTQIRYAAQRLYGCRSPKEDCEVTSNARRYAKRKDLPFNPRNTHSAK